VPEEWKISGSANVEPGKPAGKSPLRDLQAVMLLKRGKRVPKSIQPRFFVCLPHTRAETRDVRGAPTFPGQSQPQWPAHLRPEVGVAELQKLVAEYNDVSRDGWSLYSLRAPSQVPAPFHGPHLGAGKASHSSNVAARAQRTRLNEQVSQQFEQCTARQALHNWNIVLSREFLYLPR
jgi:hypothetical protein